MLLDKRQDGATVAVAIAVVTATEDEKLGCSFDSSPKGVTRVILGPCIDTGFSSGTYTSHTWP